MPIKSYRGQIADNGTERIFLRTNNGKVGYKVNKFQIIPEDPATDATEHIVKVYKQATAASKEINFADMDLLAVGYLTSLANQYQGDNIVIFDNEVINQDITITHVDANGSTACNYYLELEQVKLSDNETTMATLQSLRSRYEATIPAGPT
jgi:hypothetical protein